MKHKVRIRHKHPRTNTTKLRILQALAPLNIKISAVHHTNEGSVIITADRHDSDKLLTPNAINKLKDLDIETIISPEERANRTVICHRLDELIFDNPENEIAQEIEDHNQGLIVTRITKFPNRQTRKTNTLKVEFSDRAMATKAEQGLLMFHLSVPEYAIKKEMYIALKTCYRCYAVDDHETTDCPLPRDHKICSECAANDHTWRDCASDEKKMHKLWRRSQNPGNEMPNKKRHHQ